MRVLILSYKFYPDIGGIESISSMLASSFLGVGYEVKIVTSSLDSSNTYFPFKVIRNPSIKELFLLHRWADIVFENNPSIRLSWPSILFGRPLIISLQTWLTRVDGSTSWLDQFKHLWLKRAKIVIACSEAIRQRCWPMAIVIGNPYQDTLFKVLPQIQRIKSFVFLGRLVSDKGGDIAIRAIYELINQADSTYIRDISLTIIGDGPERTSLQTLVSELKIEDKVSFIGSLRDQSLVNCLNQHRFIIVPSLWEEPFGIVALEGMACGCIPIVSDGGGLPEAVGNAGLLFQRGNVNSLAQAMNNLLVNPELNLQLTKAASVHLNRHQLATVVKSYLDLIQKVNN